MTALGIDIGGTSTEVVHLDGSGRILGHRCVPTRSGDGLVPGTVEAVRSLVGSRTPGLVGVGVPGQVDPATGIVRHAVNLGIGSGGMPLGGELTRALGARVVVENDVRAAALGAHRHLEGCDVGVLVLLGLGTGVSAGVVIDGRIHRGRDGLAGEVGHVVFEPGGPPCGCGLRGCLEALVAGSAIAARWPHGDGSAAAHLFAAAGAGDGPARALAGTVAGHLARAVHWLVMTYGADTVVVGGGVGRVGAPLLDLVHARLDLLTSRSALAARAVGPGRLICAPEDLPLGALGAAAVATGAVTGDGPPAREPEGDRARPGRGA